MIHSETLMVMIFGVVQGLTEFIPVSSSGHLVFLHGIVQWDGVNDLALDVALHAGTLVGVMVYFFRDIMRYASAWAKSLSEFPHVTDPDAKLSWGIIVSTIPAALVGYFFETLIEVFLRNLVVVGVALIVVGVIFLFVENRAVCTRDMRDITLRDAVIIGLAQTVALIPGTSRSGITIITGMMRNLKRDVAMRFSFLLSIPLIFGATILQLQQVITGNAVAPWNILISGIAVSGVTGYLAVSFVLRYLSRHTLHIFAYYRFFIGCVIILLALQ